MDLWSDLPVAELSLWPSIMSFAYSFILIRLTVESLFLT